ncbi:MAG: metal ABC transporter substrate-binding protein [Thermoproteota archaeon]
MLRNAIGIMLLATVFLTFSTMYTGARLDGKTKIVVTIDILRPIVSSITGSRGEVYSIVPGDAEPHGLTLTPEVVRNASDADLIVITGHMEWEKDLVKRVAEERGVETGSITLNLLDLVERNGIVLKLEGGRNIHGFWLLPDNAVLIARALRDRLSSLRPEYSEEYLSNCMFFEEKVSYLKSFLESLSEKHGTSGRKVVIGFYAEQYVVEAMGLKAGAILVGEGEAISPGSLSRVYDGLKSGEYACIVVSDTALLMSGVQNALREVSRDTGCRIAYVSVVSAGGVKDYDSIMYYNAGQVYGALLSEKESVSSGINIYLLTTLAALLVIVLETIILVRRSKP